MNRWLAAWWACGIVLGAAACEGPSGEGLAPAGAGEGPRIVFDLDAKPLPEIPLPNNVATVLDSDTPTGRRLNISLQATTIAEQKLRRRINQLDGFGVFAPITVSFDSAIDIEDLRERQTGNHDLDDDGVLLIELAPGPDGKVVSIPLDMGQGNYPLGLEWPGQYWDQDEHFDSPNILFETHEEDLNGNQLLDPYEDIDFDGLLDHPNTWSGKPIVPLTAQNVDTVVGAGTARPIDDLITFYEKETNTLVLWPVTALKEQTTYAVVLTRRLKGKNGEPVRSPFKYINHVSQNQELERLPELLADPRIGMTLDDVAFAWSFTTQSIAGEFEAIRAGMYGHGKLAFLAETYPPDLEPKKVKADLPSGELSPEAFLQKHEDVAVLFESVGGLVLGYSPEMVKAMELDSQHVEYWALGTFTTPYFLADKDGIATPMYPADDNETFEIDLANGTAVHGPSTVHFMCSIPKETPTRHPPFPVVVYGHGYSGASFEIFGFAGRLAQYGFALCGLEAVGHGLALPADEAIPYDQIVPKILESYGLVEFYDAYKGGRIRDLDNDGKNTSFDNGGDFWSWDIFHTRDMVRQAVVDNMQFIRILRGLGELTWKADANRNGQADDLMGDFDGDGVLDLGGPANRFYPVWGQSMGAIVSEVLAAAEATVSAATPISGGGGLIHIGIRSTNPGVPEAVWMPIMGPFVVFSPVKPEEGDADLVEVALMINDQHRENRPDQPNRPHYYPFLRTDEIKPGDRVLIRNLTNGEEVAAFRPKDGRGFRVSLPADALSAVEKRALLGLKDGDTQPVPVSCPPGSWSVPVDDKGQPAGPAACEEPEPQRSLLFGDALSIEVRDGWDGPVKKTFEAFEIQVQYQGALYPPGTRLVALGTGFGRARCTPELRKLSGFASMILGRGDPISYASHYRRDNRLDFSYDPGAAEQANVILYHTIGDPNTPIATSLALARAAGILQYVPEADDDGAAVANDRLLAAFVPEGVEWYWRFISSKLTVTDWENNDPVTTKDMRWPNEFTELLALDPTHPLPLHADPDDLDAGGDEFGETNLDKPIRATLRWNTAGERLERAEIPAAGTIEDAGGFLALRLPYYSPMGAHGVEPSNPKRHFNINSFVENQIGLFMASDGRTFSDDPCLATCLCDFLPASIQAIGKQLQQEP
jgi:hypothetical protein